MDEQAKTPARAVELITESLQASEARIRELEQQLATRSPETRELRETVQAMETRIARLETERDELRFEVERTLQVVQDERRTAGYLRRKLHIAESGPEEATRHEINYWRGRAEALEQELEPLRERVTRSDELESAFTAADTERMALRTRLQGAERERAEQESRLCGLDADLQHRAAELQRLQALHEQSQAEQAQAIEQARVATREEMRAELEREQADDDQVLEELRTELRAADHAAAKLLTDKEQLEEQLALSEQRVEDAELEQRRLRRLARQASRRRALVGRLIRELRQRQRANMALKSGLDALRTFKHNAAVQQQKLMEKYRRARARLAELEHGEVAEDHVNTGMVQAMASPPPVDDGTLENRLQAQAKLIETLERDVERLQKTRREVDVKDRELAARDQRIDELTERLEHKQTLIDELGRDLETARRGRRETMEPAGRSASSVGLAVGDALAAMDSPREPRQGTGTLQLRALDPAAMPTGQDDDAAAGTGDGSTAGEPAKAARQQLRRD